jgi:CRISPR system Cascade subunit CasE
LLQQWSDYVVSPGVDAELPPLDCKQRSLRFARDQILVFRLRANPTVKRDGKRHGYLREEDQIRWLWRKAEEGGFGVVDVRVRPENSLTARRISGPPMSFLSVVFEGRLRVFDPERFLDTVRNGVGSAKGFGFGLLSLARPND